MKINKGTNEQSDFKKGHNRISKKVKVVRITELENRIETLYKMCHREPRRWVI